MTARYALRIAIVFLKIAAIVIMGCAGLHTYVYGGF